jgi:hypothetical protein
MKLAFFFLSVVACCLLFPVRGVKADTSDYRGKALHRHPSLRQFWREVEEELEEEVEELEPSWFHHRHLSGMMIGQERKTLAAWGITPTLTSVSNLLGNPVGGQSRKVAYDDYQCEVTPHLILCNQISSTSSDPEGRGRSLTRS